MASPRKTIRALGFVALASTSCVPRPGDVQGRSISDLYSFFSVLAAIIFVVTAGLIAWSIVRYRARPGDDELPKQFRSNVRLELLWFVIPQIIVVVLFVGSVLTLNDVDERASDPAVTVDVEGFQWGWRFTFEDAGVTVEGTASEPPEIYLPIRQTIAFVLNSNDVVHSFYVPRFLMKRDLIPGRTNRFDVYIDEAGLYGGECAEFCGLLHADMDFRIRAVPELEFEEWLDSQEGG
jgi:cytochrome c oxidase subunit II